MSDLLIKEMRTFAKLLREMGKQFDDAMDRDTEILSLLTSLSERVEALEGRSAEQFGPHNPLRLE